MDRVRTAPREWHEALCHMGRALDALDSPLPTDEELAELAFDAAPEGGSLPGPTVARALVVYGMRLATNLTESMRANGSNRGQAFQAMRRLTAELEDRS